MTRAATTKEDIKKNMMLNGEIRVLHRTPRGYIYQAAHTTTRMPKACISASIYTIATRSNWETTPYGH